ncbi:hypothetical protein AB0P15_11660 [Streptomyces sp. NPDC087917]
MDMPDEGREQEAPHLREIALFLSVHLDRAPGVLWPEYDNPAFGDDAESDAEADPDSDSDLRAEPEAESEAESAAEADTTPGGDDVRRAQVERFTGELGSLTGLSVRLDRVEGAGAAPGGPDAAPDGAWVAAAERADGREHLLIHQIAGAVTWQLAGPGEDGLPRSFQCRLLPGEVLYVPARWSRRAACTPRARYAVISLLSREG